jgi:ParB family transcriptional regulator, chromosome partitioning protein
LRHHPEKSGRYQTAYGHRRIRAASRLGIEVKAIVRSLSDDELVLAQGKENAERRNLSFIERAVFAKNLVVRGFERKVIGDALAVQKSELSRLLQVVESVPEAVIRAIGAAPKAGRDRWMKLGELLTSSKAKPEEPRRTVPTALTDRRGKVFAQVRRDGKTSRIDFAAGVDSAFIDEAIDALVERYNAFLSDRSPK